MRYRDQILSREQEEVITKIEALNPEDLGDNTGRLLWKQDVEGWRIDRIHDRRSEENVRIKGYLTLPLNVEITEEYLRGLPFISFPNHPLPLYIAGTVFYPDYFEEKNALHKDILPDGTDIISDWKKCLEERTGERMELLRDFDYSKLYTIGGNLLLETSNRSPLGVVEDHVAGYFKVLRSLIEKDKLNESERLVVKCFEPSKYK